MAASNSASPDTQREVPEKGNQMAPVPERDVFEYNSAARHRQIRHIRTVFHTEVFGLQAHHLFHFIGAALKVRHVLAHVAQIAVHNKITREDEGHVADARQTPPPEEYCIECDQCAHARSRLSCSVLLSVAKLQVLYVRALHFQRI